LPNIIKNITDETDFGIALIKVKYAFSSYHKSKEINPIPTHINRENFTLNINNTIITIISKKENSAKKILKKLISQITKSENNFTQLLGLDMQNNFTNYSSFIDENLLDTNLNTLMYHRKQLIDHDLHQEFNSYMMSILLEQARITLEDSKLKILDYDFLNKISKKRFNISNMEIAKLNIFYNGSYLNSKTKLGFGDIFVGSDDKYYLCITALCDCVLHNGKSSVDFRYFFVKGFKINLEKGLQKGDGGFISYINADSCISWTNGEYVKPIQLYIPCTNFIDKQIEFLDWDSDNNSNKNKITYLFTLKQNYAQRIANHSFAHPIRVGVDFVKKNIIKGS